MPHYHLVVADTYGPFLDNIYGRCYTAFSSLIYMVLSWGVIVYGRCYPAFASF